MFAPRQRLLLLPLWLASTSLAAAGCSQPSSAGPPSAPNPARPGGGAGDGTGAGGTGGEVPGIDGGRAMGSAGDDPGDAAASGAADASAAAGSKPVDPLNQRACQLLKTGPFVAVIGQAIFGLGAPAIKDDQQVYRISIAKRQSAHVSFVVLTPGVYVVYTSTTAPLALFALDGEMVEVTNLRMSVPECPEVKGRHTLTLKAEGKIIRLGPDLATSIDVVILPASAGPAADAAAP